MSDERDETVRRFYPVIRRIAGGVARAVPAAELDDLMSDGSVGLLRAMNTYDPAHGTTLEQYARRLILGSMLNGLRRMDPVSERVRRTLRIAERRRYALAQERDRLPSLAELERDDPALRRARLAAFLHSSHSIDAPHTGGGALADWRGEPSQYAVRAAIERELREAIARLPARQQAILNLHYYDELSLHAIGRQLRISPQRVSQIHLSALARLRAIVPRT
jgi:RNA polymerase sigma factor for flagellar operon FliA